MKPEEIAALVAEIDVKLSDPNLLDYDGLGGDDDPALALLAKARFVSDEALIARGHAAAERIAKNDHPFMSIPARPDRDVDLILSDLATRLREVLAERDEWKRKATLSGVCELAAENPNVMSYCREWEGRATKAEAAGAAKDAEIARLNGERDRYHDALIARHGGEPVALLSELDEARAERGALTAQLAEAREGAIPCQSCGGPAPEFAVSDEAWNALVRRGGPEQPGEYLCVRCFGERALATIAEARGKALEEAAKVCAALKPGWSVDVFDGRLWRDADGPWGLNSEFSAALRALSTPAAKEGIEA